MCDRRLRLAQVTAASRPPESRRLRPVATAAAALLLRLTPPGIAATAADTATGLDCALSPASRPPESRRLRRGCWIRTVAAPPPHAPRNRGDCGPTCTSVALALVDRLTPPGIAATAALASRLDACAELRLTPPGIAATAASHAMVMTWRWTIRLTPPGIAATAAQLTARECLRPISRLTPPGIAATAAQATRSQGDQSTRLTPPGIAATAARQCRSQPASCRAASRPPESRRLRHVRVRLSRLSPGIAATAACRASAAPPHAPRNRGDCGTE